MPWDKRIERLVHVTLAQHYVFTHFVLSITPKAKVVESWTWREICFEDFEIYPSSEKSITEISRATFTKSKKKVGASISVIIFRGNIFMRSDVSQNLQNKLLFNLRHRSTLYDLSFPSYSQNKMSKNVTLWHSAHSMRGILKNFSNIFQNFLRIIWILIKIFEIFRNYWKFSRKFFQNFR